MKKIFCLFISCLLCVCVNAQLPNGAYDYKFVSAYDSNGNIVRLPGHPNKINIMVVSTAFFGITQTSCSYAEYNLATGELGDYINFNTFVGQNNGWLVYSWANNLILVKSDFSRVRVKMYYYNGCYCEYRLYDSDDY